MNPFSRGFVLSISEEIFLMGFVNFLFDDFFFVWNDVHYAYEEIVFVGLCALTL